MKPSEQDRERAEDIYFRLVDLSACKECDERTEGPKLIAQALADQRERDARISEGFEDVTAESKMSMSDKCSKDDHNDLVKDIAAAIREGRDA